MQKATSWKTTVIGAIMAILLVAQPIISDGSFELKKDWKNLSIAALVALFGYLSKDHNVTGNPAVNISGPAAPQTVTQQAGTN